MKVKNQSIQALRAIAAVMVFLSHSLMMIKNGAIASLHASPLHFFFDGQCAVVFFMVLSGFFYYHLESFTIKKYIKGFKRKIVRIYPSHIIMILLGVLFCNLQLTYHSELFTDWSNSFWQAPISLKETLRQILIIIPGTNPYLVNSPAWYLVVEVRMFLLMPIISGILYYVKCKTNSIGFYALWILLVFAALRIYPFAACYLIGYMTANMYYTKMQKMAVSSLVLMGGVFTSLLLVNIRNEFDISSSSLALVIQTIGASIIILCCFIKDIFKNNKILPTLGNYSYEFYISHFVLLLLCKSLVNNVIVFWLLALILTVTITFCLHRLQINIFNRLSC